MNDSNKALTLQEAADSLGTSRSRLWRAMSDGFLRVDKRRVAGRLVWTVLESDLTQWAQEFLDESELAVANTHEQTSEHSRISANERERSSEHSRVIANEHERTETNESEQTSNPPVELYLALVDRLQRAERRTVELELTLRQSQRLLTENAESISEKEALVMESQAKIEAIEQAKQAEIDRLATELESARQSLAEAQRPKGFLSWLGLRRTRTSLCAKVG